MNSQEIQSEIEQRVAKFVPRSLHPTAVVSFMELFLRHLKDERRSTRPTSASLTNAVGEGEGK